MKLKINLTALAIVVLAITVYLPTSEAQEDPYIDNVLYSKDSEESSTVVLSGRDNATNYRYLILDDYSEAPNDWYESDFNDTSWSIGAAPFGDREISGIDPNSDWDSEGSAPYENDIILVRHKFQMSGIVTSAQIDVAFANYCTPYLNGDIIYEERGAENHVQEYWNDDGTEEISASSFQVGQNVLAVYTRDYVGGWGNSNRQWLDLQITASIFTPTTEDIIYGDTITIAVNSGNNGTSTASDVDILTYTNQGNVSSINNIDMSPNFEGLFFFKWTPEFIGTNQLNVNVSCDCEDFNYENNEISLNVTTKIYKLKTDIETRLEIINQSRILIKNITVTNNGGLPDNVTLIPSQGQINSQITFSNNNIFLMPGESVNITVNAEIPAAIADGYQNISFKVKSQYDASIDRYFIKAGKDDKVEWKWITSNGYEKLYSDTNWTLSNFNDNNWSSGLTPFGDNDVDGVDYQTLWDGDNYAYFRHIFNISNLDVYRNGLMKINAASNNFGNYYMNGILVFGDLDDGDGHGAEYWNDEVQIYTNYLLQGENIIASVVGNPQNTQWFDQEISITFPQANLWNYEDKVYNIPLKIDTVAPTTKVIESGFYKNSTEIPLSWKEISDDGDLEGYLLYYQIKEGGSISDWILHDYYTDTLTTNFSAENGIIYRFKTIGVDIYGNKENKGVYDTEIIIDMDLPKSDLWLSEGNIQYTNLNGITINWKGNETLDIQAYEIEYKKEDEANWTSYGLFSGIGDYWFEPYDDGTYLIRSTSVDYSGNKEIKPYPDITITFDRIKPVVKLSQIDLLRNTDDLMLTIEYMSENFSYLEIEYSRINEGEEDILEWKSFDERWVGENYSIRNLIDGYTYYFRVKPTDYAGNDYSREEFGYTFTYDNTTSEVILPTTPLKPVMTGKLRNVEITVDENKNGVYDKILQEYNGNDLTGMKANQYWIDYDNGKLVFGNGDIGYLPPDNSSVSISYSGYDLVTTIDNKPPMPVLSADFVINNENNLTITWDGVEDATSYIIESRNNFSRPWETIQKINVSKSKMSYDIYDLAGGYHYYRIVSVDRMGYQNSNMDGEMLEIFIEYENLNNAASRDTDSIQIDDYIIITGFLALVALAFGSYILRRNNEEVQLDVNDSSILVPVEMIAQEEVNPVEDKLPSFSIIQGSQFSRTVIFVCNTGCQREFENENESESELICPHCGLMGESPL